MSETNSPTKWATMVPLIGGSAFGCYKATGTKPQYNMSYTPFAANESFFYRHWDDVPVFLIDNEDDPLQEYAEQLGFVNSVCPCAGLSQLSTAKPGSDARAQQNKWMFESAEYVLGHVKPRVFWGENAPALFTNSGREVRDRLREIGATHGYSFSLYKTSTTFHGAPQYRDRTFYFFWDSEYTPIMNWYKREMPQLEDFLNQIPPDVSGQTESTTKEDPTSSLVRKYVLSKTQLTHAEFVEWEGRKKNTKTSYWRWVEKYSDFNEVADWIATKYGTDNKDYKKVVKVAQKLEDGKNYMAPGPFFFYDKANAMVGRTIGGTLHPTKERFLNVREVMHLMGMPNDFEFSPSEAGATLNMLAQNVPSYTAADMATEVVKYLKGELEMSDKTFLMQDNFKQKTI